MSVCASMRIPPATISASGEKTAQKQVLQVGKTGPDTKSGTQKLEQRGLNCTTQFSLMKEGRVSF